MTQPSITQPSMVLSGLAHTGSGEATAPNAPLDPVSFASAVSASAGASRAAAHQAERDDGAMACPSDLLLELLVAVLAPMFITAANVDLNVARLAAFETVTSYAACTRADLLNIAQIIAFGMAAMDSLALSLADHVPLPLKLRLRAAANGLNRSAQQNQRALDNRHSEAAAKLGPAATEARKTQGQPIQRQPTPMQPTPMQPPPMQPTLTQPALATDAEVEADVPAPIEPAGTMVGEALLRMRHARQSLCQSASPPVEAQQPNAQPAPPVQRAAALGSTTAPTRQQQNKLLWATAMMKVAGELPVEDAIPPSRRQSNSLWVAALRNGARKLATDAAQVPAHQPPQPA